jgi:hypothetical protein
MGNSAANEIPFVYVDNVSQSLTLQASAENTGSFANTILYFMSRAGSSLFKSGLIDDVRIYNRALSANEVAELARGRYSRNGPANATSSPTFTLGAPLTVSSSTIIFNGNLDVSGSNYGVILTGNFSNYATSTAFVGRSGTLTLNGTNQILNGTSTFSALTKSVTSSSSLTFDASSTQVFTGTLTLNGAASNLLSLRSSINGTQWKIDPQGTKTISYVDVQDSNNINGTAITCDDNCTNSGNNTNWTFGAAATVGGGASSESSGGGSQQSGGGAGGGGGSEPPGGGGGQGGGGQGGGGGASSLLETMRWLWEWIWKWYLELFSG